MTTSNVEQLTHVLQQHGIEMPADRTRQLDVYCRLLWDWNSKINLTRHLDYERFVARDVIDSLELSKLFQPGEEILDVGSGGGVPGIVLAILRPDIQVSLCDSVKKKAKALVDIVQGLDIPVAVHACRAEELLDQFRYDTLVARAVGPLDKMLLWFDPHWRSIGRLLTVKGPKWTDEQEAAMARIRLRNLTFRCVASYPMPGTDSQSVILEIAPRR